MSSQKSKHLIDDTILWTLIDPDKLQVNERTHLKECQICQAKQADLKKELSEMRQLACEFLPKPKRNLRPVLIEKTRPLVFLRVKNAFAYALMLMICVGGVFGLWPTQDNAIDQVAIEQETHSIEKMFQELDDNQQNDNYSILPFTFQYIVVDEFEIMANPFYDYIFPISTLETDDS